MLSNVMFKIENRKIKINDKRQKIKTPIKLFKKYKI